MFFVHTRFQCCECSCVDGPASKCGSDIFTFCLDPTCTFDPVVIAEYPDCAGDWSLIGDGICSTAENNVLCGFDGGDCCLCTCRGTGCRYNAFQCLDPGAGEELFECETQPPITAPCSAEVQRAWVVDSSAQARALTAAVNCSGGSFEVDWRGSVVVDEPIYVADGTALTVTGASPDAVIDGNAATRLFTVVNATLHLRGVSVGSGASITGGAIAAAGSILSFNQTTFVGNSAAGNGGAIHLSGGSSVSCPGGGSFADNTATIDGGAMYVTGGSSVSCGGSWVNNTAGGSGGALALSGGSAVSWDEEANFAFNAARRNGGAIDVVHGSSVSWANESTFSKNVADIFGGALAAWSSNISWSGTTTVTGNRVGEFSGGGVFLSGESSLHWTSETEFTNNTGGAIALYSSRVSWTGRTNFALNNSTIGGGALTLFDGSGASWGTERTTFTDNFGTVGGALFVASSDIAWSGNTQYAGNRALSGGAIYLLNGSTVGWTGDTEFSWNEASADGGAVGSTALDSSLNTKESTLAVNGPTAFFGNTCGANGGVLALLGGMSVDVGDVAVSFTGNSAAVAGGAIFVSGTGIGPVFTNVSFLSNSAQVGGAIAIVGSGSLKGAADVVPPNPTTFERCRFIDNTAAATGGAIDSASGQDTFISSVFEGNKAREGGALRLAGTSSMDNCTFVDNISDDGGGAAVSNIGAILKIRKISFTGNVFACELGMYLDFNVVSAGVLAFDC